MKNQSLYVMGHLDLGDSIIMNGLIRNLLDNWGHVSWFVKPEYVTAVASMMSDCERLTVLPAERGYEDPKASWIPSYLNTLRLGFFNQVTSFDQLHWDYEFYRQAHVPFNARWEDFYHAQIAPFVPDVDPKKCLVHERAENSWFVDGTHLPDGMELKFILREERNIDGVLHVSSPWSWIPEIYSAREIHVIDSAFLCLADSLPELETRPQRRVFHSYAKQYPGQARWPALGKQWEIIP